jgi:hypothetical protein
MPIYNVTIRLADGSQFIWAGRARSPRRAEVAAMSELRVNTSQQVIEMRAEEVTP